MGEQTLKPFAERYGGQYLVLPRTTCIRTMAQMAEEIIDREMANGKAHVVGISLGCLVALSISPEKTESLSLFCPPKGGVATAMRGLSCGLRYGGDFYKMSHLKMSPEQKELWMRCRLPLSHSLYHATAVIFSSPIYHKRYDESKTFVFCGEADQVTPVTDAKYIADRLHCPLTIVPECGHAIHDDAPHVIHEHLSRIV